MSTRPALSKWNHKRFENIDRRVEELGAQVEEQFSENGKKITLIWQVFSQEDLLLKQESLWKQKSHEQFIKLGDYNTRYFHQKMKRSKQKIKILGIEKEDGKLTENSQKNCC